MPTVAYRVTRGRQKFVKAPEVQKELERVLDGEVKERFTRQFDNIVKSWKPENKPQFKARKYIKTDSVQLNVYPSGKKEVYGYVTSGTKEHPIPKSPKTGKDRLFFRTWGKGSYKAKTGPRGQYKGPGKVLPPGAPLVAARQVQHPGNKARDFEKVIRNRNAKWFSKTINNAFRRALRRL